MNCIFYYGTEIPCIERTRRLTNAFVVLQDYHPLCDRGHFANFFPGCRRYLYWSPARIDANDPALSRLRDCRLDQDSAWNTVGLDIRQPKVRTAAIDRALSLLNCPGTDGLFVDNIDQCSHTDELRRAMLDLLQEVLREAKRDVPFFVNRGFEFWLQIQTLSAVLLETATPSEVRTASTQDLDWFEWMINGHLATLKAIRPKVFAIGLSYDFAGETQPYIPTRPNTPVDLRRHRLARQLENYLDTQIHLSPRLDQWPDTISIVRSVAP